MIDLVFEPDQHFVWQIQNLLNFHKLNNWRAICFFGERQLETGRQQKDAKH